MGLPMAGWVTTSRFALTTGTIASATSTAALALLAQAENKGEHQPVNAMSH